MNTHEERVNFLFDYSSINEYKSTENDRYESAFSYKEPLHKSRSTGESSQETLFSKCLRFIISSFCYVILICTFPVSFPLCVKKVPALERLVIFRLGKIEKVKGPGFVLIMPCIDQWIKVDLHAQIFKTPTQQLLTRDGAIMEVSASVHYQIVDVVRSVMQVDRLEHVFKYLVHQCLNTAVTQRDEEDVTRHMQNLQADLQNMLNKSTVAWGLEVTQVDIPPVQILKAAEPPNPMNVLMTAFNTSMGGGSTQSHSSAHQQNLNTAVICDSRDSEESINDVDEAFSHLNKMVQSVMGQGPFQGQDGVIKLQVTDVKRDFYLVIKKGNCDFYEDILGTAQNSAGVTLSLTSAVLILLLRKKLTPFKAYSDGLVTLDGDWSLLKNFTQLITTQH